MPSRQIIEIAQCMSHYILPLKLFVNTLIHAETPRLHILYQHLIYALSRLLINSGLALNIGFEYAISFTYIINSVFILLNICLVVILLRIVSLTIHFTLTMCHLGRNWVCVVLTSIFALLYYLPTYAGTFFTISCLILFTRHIFAFAATYFDTVPGACTTIQPEVPVSLTSESKVPFVSYIVVSDSKESEQPQGTLNHSHLQEEKSTIIHNHNIEPPDDSAPILPFGKMDFSPLTTTELNFNWDLDNVQVYSVQEIKTEDEGEEIEAILVPDNFGSCSEDLAYSFTAYKRVDKKVKPVSTTFPEEARVRRQIPVDPLKSLTPLSKRPPEFTPTSHITQERLDLLNINASKFLSKEEEKLFIQVMMNNEKALAFVDIERGTLKESYFSPYIIATVPHTPWEYKNIPIPPGIKDKVIEVLKDKMAAGVYEPSQSAYRSRWFCVLKKNGKLRIVHDLQPLNRVSIRDAGLPPILDDFVEPFAGRQCYTVFDLFWGFDARKVHPASRDLTAFLTPLGLLRITSMPTGYTNSPAEFQQCMVFILQDEIPHVANIFIDDLPVKGPVSQYLDENGKPETLPENPEIRRFIWEHAVDVNRIMHRIKESGATFSAKKTQICRPEVVIIGQKCTPAGRLPDDDKVAKILNWPTLTTTKEARGFMGLCGTVRIWIKNYSHLARPITELWRKSEEFVWDDRRQEAFDTLKKLVTSAPALNPIDYTTDRPVVLSVDTSLHAVGIILSQVDEQGRKRPARYGSIPMNERESRYSQPKLELYGLFRALRAYRIHLIGVKNLQVEVDAKYIKGMLNEPDLQPNAAINRWIQGILLFDFTLIHVPAAKHVGPDALSRRPLADGETVEENDDSWLDDIALFAKISETEKNHSPEIISAISHVFATTVREDQNLQNIYHFLTTLEAPNYSSPQEQKRFIKRATQFYVKSGNFWKRHKKGNPLRVILDPDQRNKILIQAHEELGHRGEQAVFETVRVRYYWPHLHSDIRHHVASCHECQIRNTKRMEIPLTVSTPATLFSKIHIDIMLMPRRKGYRYIVAARDDLSRATEGKALKKATAKALAKFFWEQIYCRYGAVIQVVTDNGPEVKGAFEILLRRLKIPQVKISPYNSKANGVVERGHFIIREAIVKTCAGNIDEWPKKVAMAFFADRVSTSSVTGFSAFYLLHGVHPILPFDLSEASFMINGFTTGMSSSDLLALRIRQLERRPADIHQAAVTLKNARFRSKAQFERKFHKKLRRSLYQSGDLVLVRNTAVEKELNRKTKPRYLGPYEVDRRTKGGSYVLKEMDGTFLRQGIAAFRLYPYIDRNSPILETLAGREESDDSDSDSDSGSDLLADQA
jgi:transposase InsO family protein